jgi:hypothetical protein
MGKKILRQEVKEPMQKRKSRLQLRQEVRRSERLARIKASLNNITDVPDLILESRRGSQTSGGKCNYCDSYASPLWRYTESTWGTVYLCKTCKITIRNKSFGHSDAMWLKVPGSIRN